MIGVGIVGLGLAASAHAKGFRTHPQSRIVGVCDTDPHRARAFAETAPGTLVVVTADHETGGLAVSDLQGRRGRPTASWGTMGHTAAPVAIFAEGPGATAFTGVLDAAEVGRRLRAVLGLGD